MSCKEVRRWMSPYLDSELGETKTFEVSEHLRVCSGCAARFEAERRVDTLVRTNLEPAHMPDALWNDINRTITTPKWVRSLYKGRNLAMAACLGLALVAVALFGRDHSSVPAPTIVRRFEAEVSAGFEADQLTSDRSSIDRVVENALGGRLIVGAAARTGQHYDLKTIGAVQRTGPDGRAYVELQLQCCQQPVMVVLARRQHGRLPALFQGVSLDRRGTISSFDGVNLGVKTFGDTVAIVTARHPIAHIVNNLSFKDI